LLTQTGLGPGNGQGLGRDKGKGLGKGAGLRDGSGNGQRRLDGSGGGRNLGNGQLPHPFQIERKLLKTENRCDSLPRFFCLQPFMHYTRLTTLAKQF